MFKQSWRQLSQYFNDFKETRALIKRGLFEYDVVIPKSGPFKDRPGRVDYFYKKSSYNARERHADIIYYKVNSSESYAKIERDTDSINNLRLWCPSNKLIRPLVVGDVFYVKKDLGIYLFSRQIGREGKEQRLSSFWYREKQTLYRSETDGVFHEYNIDVSRTNQHMLKLYNTKLNPKLPSL